MIATEIFSPTKVETSSFVRVYRYRRGDVCIYISVCTANSVFQVSKRIRKMRRDNYVVVYRDRNVFLVNVESYLFFKREKFLILNRTSNISFLIFFPF